MSTFDGIVPEFPLIRIDNFRHNPDNPRPLACFLSHAHCDHLRGLESFKSPFVYCSAATREILLRIEEYPRRVNFNKGILECRILHYKHLSKLLRPIPLQVPTEIELTPNNRIRVTLFDANHCPGSVMFLIEGGGKAIIYTGDIRAESWWVNSLVRHPVLIPYSLGKKRLDKIYLDTTFAIKSNIYERFPSKAEGIQELLEQVLAYPDETVFYLPVWTFGYEEVWLALANALRTRVHVDRYQWNLYRSLSNRKMNGFGVHEGPYLCGFTLGNNEVPGCMTGSQDVRVHSCQNGNLCSVIANGPSVSIFPIVSRTANGDEIPEVGAGGGKGDLFQTRDLELPDDSALHLIEACNIRIKDECIREKAIAVLSETRASHTKSLSLDNYGIENEDVLLQEFVSLLGRGPKDESLGKNIPPTNLPKTIKFPYSRHSSYFELCHLVSVFNPKDIYPCTVDEKTWSESVSVRTLFGHLCSGNEFAHDAYMRRILEERENDNAHAHIRPYKRVRRDLSSDDSNQETQITNIEPSSDYLQTSIVESHPQVQVARRGQNAERPEFIKQFDGDKSPATRSGETKLPLQGIAKGNELQSRLSLSQSSFLPLARDEGACDPSSSSPEISCKPTLPTNSPRQLISPNCSRCPDLISISSGSDYGSEIAGNQRKPHSSSTPRTSDFYSNIPIPSRHLPSHTLSSNGPCHRPFPNPIRFCAPGPSLQTSSQHKDQDVDQDLDLDPDPDPDSNPDTTDSPGSQDPWVLRGPPVRSRDEGLSPDAITISDSSGEDEDDNLGAWANENRDDANAASADRSSHAICANSADESRKLVRTSAATNTNASANNDRDVDTDIGTNTDTASQCTFSTSAFFSSQESRSLSPLSSLSPSTSAAAKAAKLMRRLAAYRAAQMDEGREWVNLFAPVSARNGAGSLHGNRGEFEI